MEKIFDITKSEMDATKSFHTLQEIYQQPNTWKKTCAQVKSMKDELQAFINQVVTLEDYDIILTGAGTSEFVGNSVYTYLAAKYGYKVKSYGTTDLVSSPQSYLSKTKPTLLVSYGRSGNSPESVGAVDVAESVCDTVYHLFITCNKDGALSKRAESSENCFAINLTDETHDVSFAMTSSFSNMYLATLLAFNLDNIDGMIENMECIIDAGQNFLDNQYGEVVKLIAEYDFQRIVYLGNNGHKGVAQESALKMLELSAGKVVTMFDTALGFRHGPKSIVNDETLTVVYISDDEYTRKFEIDLIKEMSGQRKGNKLVAVCAKHYEGLADLVDYVVEFKVEKQLDNVFLGLTYIMYAQSVAVLKSLALGNTPDNPCPTGEVNRVVQGVTLYPYVRR